ncbi:cytochrome P450 [Pluteus cervinus]|uniref:Cytochrome P450 n=1 Tax=Pluteus cervinus TaxID=181527 RepID=A0ACD3B3J9_9AGAR|nr:cytochrome P450 [Pluteus cervinus]
MELTLTLSASNLILMAVGLWGAKWLVNAWIALYLAFESIEKYPGQGFLLLHPFRGWTIVLGTVFPPRGCMGDFYAAFSLYKKYGSTCLSSVVLWGAVPTYWLSDADAIKAVTADRSTFTKDVQAYEALNMYGLNILSVDGPEWKKHRTIANPAFNDSNNNLVWKQTISIANEWFSDIDQQLMQNKKLGDPTTLVDLSSVLARITLSVIAFAGFGRRAPWSEDIETPGGQVMTFKPAVIGATKSVIPYVVTPTWLYNLAKRVRIPLLTSAGQYFDALKVHMLEVISHSRAKAADGKGFELEAALLRNLVQANMIEGMAQGCKLLSDDELLADMFAFLLAGHDTLAHSMTFAIELLSLYPEVQDKVREEAACLWPDGFPCSESVGRYKESMNQLGYTTAVFQESLRLHPAVPRLSKIVQRDTILPTRQFSSGPDGAIEDVMCSEIHVKPGNTIIIDIVGLQRNPIHWGNDAEEFKPERFIDTPTYHWPRNAFLAFSSGPRSCIGQRFALTEATCLLAGLVLKYEILPPKNLKGTTREERQANLLKWIPSATATPINAFVRLRRRK